MERKVCLFMAKDCVPPGSVEGVFEGCGDSQKSRIKGLIEVDASCPLHAAGYEVVVFSGRCALCVSRAVLGFSNQNSLSKLGAYFLH